MFNNMRGKSWLPKSFLPKSFLLRLTLLNVIVVTFFIGLSSWAIYNSACFLVDGMATMSDLRQDHFNSTLFYYLGIFSVASIVAGSVIHFFLTKKLLAPLKELIESTKRMKQGQYPNPIEVASEDETGQLISHFNGLIQQLKYNQQYRRDLVSDLSHEFRTPLANLSGYLNALKNGVIEGDQKLYQALYEESKRLSTMVEQFEQLKEWDYISHQVFYEKEIIDMALIIQQAVEMFRWSLKKANIPVQVQVEHGLVEVFNEGVPQVISNLIDNAIRYYQGPGPITIIGKGLEREYRVSVIGPGQAIPEEARDKIFERFYRVDSSRSRETGGSGLGLAISKEIVAHHKGKLGIKSDGNNHTFWFTLPLHK